MPTCVIKGCNNRPEMVKNDKIKRITFHRFPVNKSDLMKSWLYSIGTHNLKDHIKIIHTTSIICSDHFESKHFNFLKRTRLLPDAVPTVFKPPTESEAKNSKRWILANSENSCDEDDLGSTNGSNKLSTNAQVEENKSAEINIIPCENVSATDIDFVKLGGDVLIDFTTELASKAISVGLTSGNKDVEVAHIVEPPPVAETLEIPHITEQKDALSVDEDISLASISAEDISNQVFPHFVETQAPVQQNSTLETLKVKYSSIKTRKTKLNIPSTCFQDEDNGCENNRPAAVKRVVLRASNKLMKRSRLNWKVPAQIIRKTRRRKLHDFHNRNWSSNKTEWVKPVEDLVCIADVSISQEGITPQKQLCRICASEQTKTVSIFGKQGKSMKLAEKINKYLPIEVLEKDKLPLQVCIPCIEKLEICVNLSESTQEADLKLRFMLEVDELEIDVMDVAKSEILEDKKVNVEHSNSSYYCKICSKNFVGFQPYFRHNYAVHKKRKCKSCKEFFDTKDELLKHWIEHHGVQCECCGLKFRNVITQLSHLRLAHPEFKAHSCEKCGKSFYSKYALAIHHESHQLDKPFLCDSCGKSFKSKRRLKIHKCDMDNTSNVSFGNLCQECGNVYTLKSSLVRHMRRHGERRFECELCHKRFFGPDTLKNHMVVHTKSTLYECQMCCARYFHKRNMITHINTKHSMPWSYKCPSCDQIFASIDEVAMHKKTHDAENVALGIPQVSDAPPGSCLDFQCKICCKTFENIYVLTMHFEEHVVRGQEELNIKSSECGLFECTMCGEKLSSVWLMKRHMRKVHREHVPTGKKTYDCEICSKQYSSKFQLRRHIWQHTGEKPYKCPYCDAGFRTQLAVQVHARIHTGDAPYQCQSCSKKFRSAANLRAHKSIHDKPFSCHHCGQRFPRMSTCRNHILLHNSSAQYKCSHCDFVSKTRSAIKKHEDIHLQQPGPSYVNL